MVREQAQFEASKLELKQKSMQSLPMVSKEENIANLRKMLKEKKQKEEKTETMSSILLQLRKFEAEQRKEDL